MSKKWSVVFSIRNSVYWRDRYFRISHLEYSFVRLDVWTTLIQRNHILLDCSYSFAKDPLILFLLSCSKSVPCDSFLTTGVLPCGSSIYALFTHPLFTHPLDGCLHIFSSTNIIQYLNSTLEDLFPQIQKTLHHNRCKRSFHPFEDSANTITSLTCGSFKCCWSRLQWNNYFLLKTRVTINFPLSNDTCSPVLLLILISKIWLVGLFRGSKWGCS